MAVTATWLSIDGTRVVPALLEAGQKLDGADGELILDFSAVGRVDSSMLRALEEFARVAEEKTVRIVLRGVHIDVYKVLKLLKLTRRFSFVSGDMPAGNR